MQHKSTYHALFENDEQVGIGVYDPFSASLAARYRFDFLWISSFSVSASLGFPDVGLLGPAQILDITRGIENITELPVVVDIDSGYGDSLKVFKVAIELAKAGARAICIEDNPISKRCSLYDGYKRTLISAEEHASKVRAAKHGITRTGRPCAVIARTEALVAGNGVDEALRRAHTYYDAGADAIFIQSVDRQGTDILAFCERWDRRTPVFIAPTKYPDVKKHVLFSAGVSHIIFANQAIRMIHSKLNYLFEKLQDADCSHDVDAEISTVQEITATLGIDDYRQFENLFLALPDN